MSVYTCIALMDNNAFDAKAEIKDDRLEIRGKKHADVLYADICDIRLLNYRVMLFLKDRSIELSSLGYETENFFEQLWLAYEAKSREALLIDSKEIMTCEGDYSYTEEGRQRSSIAKLILYPEALCIVPHDSGARRFPFCFGSTPERSGFILNGTQDTGEFWQIKRLGRDTEPFFSCLLKNYEQTVKKWLEAHRRLDEDITRRLGERSENFEVFMGAAGATVAAGLFALSDPEFWFAAVKDGRAAVELVTEEDAATYLYRYEGSDDEFILKLRHAMETVRKHRELIYITDEKLAEVPMYRMAVDRSPHVIFLRSANAGRVIHNSAWERNVLSWLNCM